MIFITTIKEVISIKDRVKLYNGDCLKIMDELIKQGIKVDAIITDPPYGTMNTDGGEKLGIKNWDIEIEPNDIFTRSNKLLRKNGRLILFSQDPYTYKLQNNQIPNLPYNYKMIWLKDNFANSLGCNRNPVYFSEDILLFTKRECYDAVHPLRGKMKLIAESYGIESIVELFLKEGRYKNIQSAKVHTSYKFGFGSGMRFDLMDEKLFNYLKQFINFSCSYDSLKNIDIEYKNKYKAIFNLPKGEKYKSNILEYKKDYEGLHPTQKPIKLIEDLIETYTNEDDLVLDFTMGSGSTGVACVNTNRKFIGIELDENYFKIAENRINEQIKQNVA